jgi:type 1 glutamine amidotransferase
MALSIPAIVAMLVLSLPVPQNLSPIRVLVVTGGHSYPTSFYTIFEQPGIAWDHAASSEEAYKTDLRERYDVLVLYDMPKALSETGAQNLRAFAEAGNGIVVLHHAIVSYPKWDWYRDLIGGRYLDQPLGSRAASTYRHDEQMRIAIAQVHPVTEGLTPFTLRDETYKGLWLAPTNAILLTTDNPTGDPPVAWVSAYSRARVVTIQLGHGPESHRDKSYSRLVLNAIKWTSGRPN